MCALAATWQRLFLSAFAAAAVIYVNNWLFAAATFEVAPDPRCPAWDHETSIGIALLVPVDNDLAEVQLDDALYRLRRARKNCRAGRLDLARQDYDALQRLYPFPAQRAAYRQPQANPD